MRRSRMLCILFTTCSGWFILHCNGMSLRLHQLEGGDGRGKGKGKGRGSRDKQCREPEC